jgi:hypothetical protein
MPSVIQRWKLVGATEDAFRHESSVSQGLLGQYMFIGWFKVRT